MMHGVRVVLGRDYNFLIGNCIISSDIIFSTSEHRGNKFHSIEQEKIYQNKTRDWKF